MLLCSLSLPVPRGHRPRLRLGGLAALVLSVGSPALSRAEPPPTSNDPPGAPTEAAPAPGLLARLRPTDLTVTLGVLFPGFLIYEYPGPWTGVELGWRTSARTRLVANAGFSVVSMQGSQRYFTPLGLSLRASPWKNGPWGQIGLGSMPYLEHIRVALPQRTVSTTDLGATLTYKVHLGVHFRGWDLGLGTDGNLLPWRFYRKYKGEEALPWSQTLVVWFGRRL